MGVINVLFNGGCEVVEFDLLVWWYYCFCGWFYWCRDEKIVRGYFGYSVN